MSANKSTASTFQKKKQKFQVTLKKSMENLHILKISHVMKWKHR